MNYNHQPRSKFDSLVSDLCYEIDDLKQERDEWKQRYEELMQESIAENKRHSDYVMKGVGDALMLAFSIREGEDGTLVIDKDNRKSLAEHFSPAESL